jgi:hypothetical protein
MKNIRIDLKDLKGLGFVQRSIHDKYCAPSLSDFRVENVYI